MKTWRWIGGSLMAGIATMALQAQVPEPVLTRPGAVVITQITGDVFASSGDQRRPGKADERLRPGSTISTGRKSLATVTLSNGATLQIGSESELEVEEFNQAPFSGNAKVAEMKEEPSISRTRLRLLKGDIAVEVKPLKVSRGSSFTLAMAAGTVKLSDGSFHVGVRLSDLGLGVCTLELQRGAAELELPGAAYAPVPLGRKLAFALELDRATGAWKVGEMPKETSKTKK